MERGLARITQRVPVAAAFERHAHQAMHRRSDFPHCFQFVVNHFAVGLGRLKQIAIKPAKVAIDVFSL